MDHPKTGPKTGANTGAETGSNRDAPGAEESGAPQPAPWPAPWPAPRAAPRADARFRHGREFLGLAEDWAALRRDAFQLDRRLREVAARLVALEGRGTGDAHARLTLVTQVLRHHLGLAPDHRALRLAGGALAALEGVHQAAEPPETVPGVRERPPARKKWMTWFRPRE